MKRRIRFAGPAVAITFTMMLGFGCSKAERQEIKAEYQVKKEEAKMDTDAKYSGYEWKEGVKYANKGYDQLSDFDTKVFKDEPERAKLHLERAAKDFDSSLTHFGKSEVGLDGQKAIKDFNSGVDALNTAYNELDAGNIDSAQSQYDKASEYFAKADAILQ
jgi:tetratricopeptide (TPR) repeat protein